MLLGLLCAADACAQSAARAPATPAPSSARILLLPRRIVAGERATLAVLDVGGRLTPGVTVSFSNGDRVTTDATGRGRFVAPLNPGVIFGSLQGRPGRVATTILGREQAAGEGLAVSEAPRFASLADRFDLTGHGFCGDADANDITAGGAKVFVLASSPVALVLLPPAEIEPGPAVLAVDCAKNAAPPVTVRFVSLSLEASAAPLAPGEKRAVLVRVRGTTSKLGLEARNLAPEAATLTGGSPVRAVSSGGTENVARFEVTGLRRGSFLVSIRLLPSYAAPR